MNLKRRLFNDFFRPSKAGEYERILAKAQEMGYEFHTILSYEDVIAKGRDPQKKYLILRRDVDTADFKILREMLRLEKKYGARCTYYFRWNTYNVPLMRAIEASGGEASYHYEEMATYCYKHQITRKEEMWNHIEEIRSDFIANYAKFKRVTGMPCLTVASHGDYVNSIFHLAGYVIMNDRIRTECGFVREAYDDAHMKMLTCRIADQVEMESFTEEALAAIERGEPVLELLTHPRQWNSPIWVNLKEECNRVFKQLYMGV